MPDGAETVLCTAAVGSSVPFPRVVGAAIAFTQAIYHRTLWLCDPRTGALSPISDDIDDPSTAEIEATADASRQF